MQRVVIIGNSGGGKSTLARRLGARLTLPVVHLDRLYYQPGWRPGDPEVFRARVAEALSGDRWIVDGNFLSVAGELFLPRADAILWLRQPRWLCLARAARRCIDLPNRGRAELPAGCRDSLDPDMLGFIWSFDRVTRPGIEAQLARFAVDKAVTALDGDRGVRDFLAALPPAS
jgi:adenylate kinase family enzyme